MKLNKTHLVSAAVAGILGAALATSSQADESKMNSKMNSKNSMAKKDTAEKGKCMGGNDCAGKGACAVTGQNDCHGKAAKGKGWVETTKTECDKKKTATFEAMNK